MAACTRETVNRALHALRRKKYVTRDRQTLRLDLQALQRLLATDIRVPSDGALPAVV